MSNEIEIKTILNNLNERKKELNCIYRVGEILSNTEQSVEEIFQRLIVIIPYGWQFSDLCSVQIVYQDMSFQTPNMVKSRYFQEEPLRIEGKEVGSIRIFYREDDDNLNEFLEEEEKLLQTIADKISNFLHHKSLKEAFAELERSHLSRRQKPEWKTIAELLRRTDTDAYLRIARKLMNYLFWIGRTDSSCNDLPTECEKVELEPQNLLFTNKPISRMDKDALLEQSTRIFMLAESNLDGEEILLNIQKWILEDKTNFLGLALEDLATSLSDIQNALERFHFMGLDKVELSNYTRKNLSVLLILRFFTDQLEFINIAKNFVDIDYFRKLTQRMIFPSNSHGKLGGKSAGIFLAQNIINALTANTLQGINIKFPKTWYITSDTMHRFLYYNNLEEIIEQKYKDIEQVREEYPNIIQLFKNSQFPPDILKEMNRALDDFGKHPIIVRSSSLLEDRVGAVFSGKYKSLFLANQGNRHERLSAIADAISEVYASAFGPDPIEYRRERGLLDFHEEMAIIIQEVVGKKVGDYFLPAFAGVAFNHNEFRWSPRIRREDGLIRLVPGLGTRAVDRLGDDYPVLIAPGQPNLRVNVSKDEILRYSPKKLDVINLKTNSFETLEMKNLLRECGEEYPLVEKMVSFYEQGELINKNRFNVEFKDCDPVVTFHGFYEQGSDAGNFVNLIGNILKILKEHTNRPVDIEFASDGSDFYLLQCRSQSAGEISLAVAIPKDINPAGIIFTARRFISNGQVNDITHIVYVDPEGYSQLDTLEDMQAVGRAVGKLNKLLPKRKFILMGPGRWGSRGDIKLGVNVTYSDINNTAALIEIARKKGNFTSDLSFGTHFFQDLVETGIIYLPLYPDDRDIVFNERFLKKSPNILPQLLPEYEYLSSTVHVIDIPSLNSNQILRILMNADLDEALAYLSTPGNVKDLAVNPVSAIDPTVENHWLWRLRMAENIAGELDAQRFCVENIYIFGSVKNANAGPASDIDLLVHCNGDEKQRSELLTWLDGWSLCLAEINYLRTGYQTDGLLDVHLITDADIASQNSYAIKINAITDAAKLLKMGE
ncbi:MAG: pyruvate, phosphate dikinase [Candidatus Cloacimonetes bacterium]|nr:pyruvate, phosphate dikinase [Candidatus Cloacimonadota bacterium]